MVERLPDIEPFDLSGFDDTERAALVVLAGLPAMTPKRFWGSIAQRVPTEALRLVRSGRNPIDHRPLYREWQQAAVSADPVERLTLHRVANIDVHCFGDDGYPPMLLDDHEPPPVLFGVGPAVIGSRRSVAIVGTRRCTSYGRSIAQDLAVALAEHQIDIVSGLARGIDAGAHLGAIKVRPDAAIAVVAGGLDIVYPQGNRELWRQIAETGRIVSEWPMGVRPQTWSFPARNRIIAAFAEATVVVESRVRGGSMHTVEAAMERGRRVFTVPGSIRSPVSAGTNRLLVDGAEVLCSIEEFVASIAPGSAPPQTGEQLTFDESNAGNWLLAAVGYEPITIDGLVRATSRSVVEIIAAVEVEIARGVLRRSGPAIERTP